VTNSRHRLAPTTAATAYPAATQGETEAAAAGPASGPLDGMGKFGHARGKAHLGDEAERVGGPGR
jgi:hypothetical protein